MSTLIKEINIYYTQHGRSHLPWRKTRDPYKILVSEIMLQQTQVDRVLPKYTLFIKTFPTVAVLANALFPQVLGLWSGLGYNRRAKFLHEAAQVIVRDHKGKVPKDVTAMEALPGIGPYTARAVAAFAHNQPVVFIETNIRTVFTHFYFSLSTLNYDKSKKISDAEIFPLVAEALKSSRMEPQEFYAALMDYGAYLKRAGVQINNRSKHYTKQSKFKGSTRQLRGEILRKLLKAPQSSHELQKVCESSLEVVERELSRLLKEGLILKRGVRYTIAK